MATDQEQEEPNVDFSVANAIERTAKSILWSRISRYTSDYSHKQLEQLLIEPPEKIHDLLRGKLSDLTLEDLDKYEAILSHRYATKKQLSQQRISGLFYFQDFLDALAKR